MSAMPALRSLWAACCALYEDTLALVAANLIWVLLNLPLLLLLLVLLPVAPASLSSLLLIFTWLLLFVPTPASLALGALAREAANADVPRLGVFFRSLRQRWRLGLVLFLISLVVAVVALANVYFWLVLGSGPLRFVSVLWLYAALFWLCMHVYLVPLAHHVTAPRVVDLYRRAAVLVLGHPGFSFLVLLELMLFGALSVVFLPVYVFIGGALVALVQAHALREIRRRHGDLLPQAEDEILRL